MSGAKYGRLVGFFSGFEGFEPLDLVVSVLMILM